MNAVELFRVFLRIMGVILLGKSISGIIMGIILSFISLAIRQSVNWSIPGINGNSFLFAFLYFLYFTILLVISIWLMKGCKRIVKFCYPKSQDE